MIAFTFNDYRIWRAIAKDLGEGSAQTWQRRNVDVRVTE